MKQTFAAVLVATLTLLAACNRGGTPGGPGATATQTPIVGQSDNTFTLSVPTLSTALQQGEAKTATIGIKRGKNFSEDVALKFSDTPKGLAIDPMNPVIKHGDTEAKFTLKAADDAALGDFVIKVTGHPTKGTDALNEFKVTVNKK